MKKTKVLALLLFIVISFGATACSNKIKTIDIGDLLESYKKHPTWSNLRYKYRTINITGVIANLDTFDNLKKGDNYFTVKITKDSYTDILDFALCEFPKKDADSAMKLKAGGKIISIKPGDKVTIRGIVSGYRMFLFMTDCELVNVDEKFHKP